METILSSARKRTIISPDEPLVIIGERINPTGRKKLAAEMAAGDWTRVEQDAQAQVEAGASVLDVNAGVPGGDEPALIRQAVEAVSASVDVPLCLDSANPLALEAALSVYTGRALVNSVTGEEASLERVLPLVKKYDAVVVGLANDERGISTDPRVRLEVARKIVARAGDHGIPAADVVIDPLVLTVGADSNAARVTLETIRLIRTELGVNVSAGISNVSFGLPNRPALNAAFLAMAIAAGLTAAIVNPLEPSVRQTALSANLLAGHDAYGRRWIKSTRHPPGT